MRSRLPVLLVGVLLLAACGSQPAPAAHPTDTSCDTQPGGEPAESGVRITGVSLLAKHCAEFEVTNTGSRAAVYTVTFAFLASSGEALVNPRRTAPVVEPGRTVRDTVRVGEQRTEIARVKIIKVRNVPAAEAPSAECPSSGLRLYGDDDAEAAMGLRVLGVHLENCGPRASRLNGYPKLELLDENHKPIRTVKILQGSSAITSGQTGADGVAKLLVLEPGERASAHLVWRNTVEAGGADVNSPYVRVWAKPGVNPVMLTPELDLGTTGKLGVGPWKKDQP
ncbi:DUF4232 domain-containing protein [Kribbella sp. NPDC056345]|uniref:DUF4232 domain-containing protein n=1 Tax=Kribbella sp. NPDC056345 TaxID=3345789 RepID=UPI0035DD32BE